jgi:hypothetical protein
MQADHQSDIRLSSFLKLLIEGKESQCKCENTERSEMAWNLFARPLLCVEVRTAPQDAFASETTHADRRGACSSSGSLFAGSLHAQWPKCGLVTRLHTRTVSRSLLILVARRCLSSSKIPFFPDLEAGAIPSDTAKTHYYHTFRWNGSPKFPVSLRGWMRGTNPFQNHHPRSGSPRTICLTLSLSHPQANPNPHRTHSRMPSLQTHHLSQSLPHPHLASQYLRLQASGSSPGIEPSQSHHPARSRGSVMLVIVE